MWLEEVDRVAATADSLTCGETIRNQNPLILDCNSGMTSKEPHAQAATSVTLPS